MDTNWIKTKGVLGNRTVDCYFRADKVSLFFESNEVNQTVVMVENKMFSATMPIYKLVDILISSENEQ